MSIKWKKFTKWHWRTMVDGKPLDYWPSKGKWKFSGETQTGDVNRFIRDLADQQPDANELKTEKSAWWSYCKVDNSVRVYVVHKGRSKRDAAPDVLKALRTAVASYGSAA
jgi:hypothetical protein